MAKVLLIIAQNGFQNHELEATRAAIKNTGHQVFIASMKNGKAYSNIGSSLIVDYAINEVRPEEFDGIYIIGGPGALDSLDNEQMHAFIKSATKINKMRFGAICIAPRILLNAKVLQGARITGWNEDGKLPALCALAGAIYVNEPVVVDRRIITANGPTSADNFGTAIAKAIGKNQ